LKLLQIKLSKLHIYFGQQNSNVSTKCGQYRQLPVRAVKAIFSSPDTEHACLPEDVIQLLTDVEHVGSE
jgi:hypothetical protein